MPALKSQQEAGPASLATFQGLAEFYEQLTAWLIQLSFNGLACYLSDKHSLFGLRHSQ